MRNYKIFLIILLNHCIGMHGSYDFFSKIYHDICKVNNQKILSPVLAKDMLNIISEYIDEYDDEAIDFCAHPGILSGHSIAKLLFSPFNTYLISISEDGTIKTFDMKNLGRLNCQSQSFYHIDPSACTDNFLFSSRLNTTAISHSGKFLATGGALNSINVWSIDTNLPEHAKRIRNFRLGEGSSSVSYPTGKYEVRDFGSEEIIETATTTYNIIALSYSPCGKYLAAISDAGNITILDMENLTTLYGELAHNLGCAFSPTEKYLASFNSSTIFIRDMDRSKTTFGKVINNLSFHASTLKSIVYSPCGKYLCASMIDDRHPEKVNIDLIDMDTNKATYCNSIFRFNLTCQGNIENILLEYSSCGKYLICGTSDGHIKIWDMNPNSKTYYKTYLNYIHAFYLKNLSAIAFYPQEKYLVAGSKDGYIKMWRNRSLSLLDTNYYVWIA